MGSLEVIYEFKNKCQYLIASPTETLSQSFPYHLMINKLFGDKKQLIESCRDYYNFYNSFTDQRKSASIAFYDCTNFYILTQFLSELKVSNVIESYNIQRLDYSPDFPIPLYDFEHFLQNNFDDKIIYNFKSIIEKIIPYKASTANFIDLPLEHYSGLSIWIPDLDRSDLISYYKSLRFYQETQLFLYL